VITDAGLAHPKALTDLHVLNLKGTRVTDTRVRDFERALPGVRVGR
jgi:hypothetical protein